MIRSISDYTDVCFFSQAKKEAQIHLSGGYWVYLSRSGVVYSGYTDNNLIIVVRPTFASTEF